MSRAAPPAVILAAGFGSRLLGAGSDLPKALVPVNARPLLSYTLDGLAAAGVQRVVVVVGHRGELVAEFLSSWQTSQASSSGNGRYAGLAIEVVRNPRFDLPNGSSLAAARAAVDGAPFLLLMADHLLSAVAVQRLLAQPDRFAVGVDRGPLPPERLIDAMRVRVSADGLVEAFGKQLERWDAIDAGIFTCLPDVFAIIDELGSGAEVGAIMTAAAARHPFYAVDLEGAFWLDVDTPADLSEAERLLRAGAWMQG